MNPEESPIPDLSRRIKHFLKLFSNLKKFSSLSKRLFRQAALSADPGISGAGHIRMPAGQASARGGSRPGVFRLLVGGPIQALAAAAGKGLLHHGVVRPGKIGEQDAAAPGILRFLRLLQLCLGQAACPRARPRESTHWDTVSREAEPLNRWTSSQVAPEVNASRPHALPPMGLLPEVQKGTMVLPSKS